MRRTLPAHLHDAYDWTDAAGELEQLRSLARKRRALERYCRESARNCRDNGDGTVTELALEELSAWLASEAAQ